MRCQECHRRLTNDASRALGIGPTCLERMRDRGLVVGGRKRAVLGRRSYSRGLVDPRQVDWIREIGA